MRNGIHPDNCCDWMEDVEISFETDCPDHDISTNAAIFFIDIVNNRLSSLDFTDPHSLCSQLASLDKNALREIKLRLSYLQVKSTTMSVIAHQTEKEWISANEKRRQRISQTQADGAAKQHAARLEEAHLRAHHSCFYNIRKLLTKNSASASSMTLWRQTAGEIFRHTTQATGRPISRFTVARRLHGGGLFARRPVRCVALTPAHRRRRSLWCQEHRNWRDNEWERVLFTDESRFSLSSDSHRILIWRERGSRNHPSNIIERDRYGGRGVLVWEGIMLGSRTDLHIFDAGSVNGTRYCNEILLPYVRLFRGAMGLQFLFMDDNAPCHLTVAAEQLLESEDIERMDWPARFPDLNPIEHVWDFLGRRLAARTLPPVTIWELRLALQDEWAPMPQQLIETLILSMGRRFETCLSVRGDHIPY
ncbi:transposable element Tcb2 transposase [Trichonephila clavipes]|uniref:Transposable element Tcb2 transposase n=1 Tax=Trichonephila clavipes TaxID=2585209 RepID=A0A8X6RFM2_TRICX|nr:transposable element Tcb2 transposase [Trichonephila clavipes]